jgi:hypothetical protein
MINNILNRPKRSITMTRIINQAEEPEVITNPEEIKNIARKHFQNWTAKTKEIVIPQEWQQEYTPKDTISKIWYDKTTSPFTDQEIKEVINKANSKSAAGPSGIPYIAYKQLKTETITYITALFNTILETEVIPIEWLKGTIYPIPKTADWENDINITRPITLLETIKKIFTKCITNRLAKVMTEHEILCPYNWAALPQNNTALPITITNCAIEDARQNQQELWILFQDMSKAYDTVDIGLLTTALQ